MAGAQTAVILAAENLSRLPRIALNLSNREATAHIASKGERLKAGRNQTSLLTVLAA